VVKNYLDYLINVHLFSLFFQSHSFWQFKHLVKVIHFDELTIYWSRSSVTDGAFNCISSSPPAPLVKLNYCNCDIPRPTELCAGFNSYIQKKWRAYCCNKSNDSLTYGCSCCRSRTYKQAVGAPPPAAVGGLYIYIYIANLHKAFCKSRFANFVKYLQVIVEFGRELKTTS